MVKAWCIDWDYYFGGFEVVEIAIVARFAAVVVVGLVFA